MASFFPIICGADLILPSKVMYVNAFRDPSLHKSGSNFSCVEINPSHSTFFSLSARAYQAACALRAPRSSPFTINDHVHKGEVGKCLAHVEGDVQRKLPEVWHIGPSVAFFGSRRLPLHLPVSLGL